MEITYAVFEADPNSNYVIVHLVERPGGIAVGWPDRLDGR